MITQKTPGSEETGDEQQRCCVQGMWKRCDRENVAGREGFEPSRGLLP